MELFFANPIVAYVTCAVVAFIAYWLGYYAGERDEGYAAPGKVSRTALSIINVLRIDFGVEYLTPKQACDVAAIAAKFNQYASEELVRGAVHVWASQQHLVRERQPPP